MDDPTGNGYGDINGNMWGAIVAIFTTIAGGFGLVFRRFSNSVDADTVQNMIDKDLEAVKDTQKAFDERLSRADDRFAQMDTKLDTIINKLMENAERRATPRRVVSKKGKTSEV